MVKANNGGKMAQFTRVIERIITPMVKEGLLIIMEKFILEIELWIKLKDRASLCIRMEHNTKESG